MAELRRFGPLDLLALVLVVAVAGGVRAGYLMKYADGANGSGPLRVQDRAPSAPDASPTEMEDLIATAREGGFYTKAPFAKDEERTAHVSPGYPHLVGLLGRVVADESLFRNVRWIQAGLGALTAGLYFLFARRAFRSLGVGAAAGALCALNPFSVIATATIDDGVLASFALAAALFLGSQAGEKGGALPSLLLGLVLAGLALVRASLLPFSFVAMIWFLLRSRTLERGWLCALVAFLGFVGGLAPWTVRNFQALDSELVPVVSSSYLHLWIGNAPGATGGPATPELWSKAPENMWAYENQAIRYAKLGERVKDEVQKRPVATVRRRVHAFLAFYLGDSWLRDGTLVEETPPSADDAEEVASARERVPMLLQSWLAGMLLLALIGWRWSYGYRWESFPAALAAFWVPLPYVLGHAEALSGPRLPLDGVLLCYAALTLVGLLPFSWGLLNPERSGPPEDLR